MQHLGGAVEAGGIAVDAVIIGAGAAGLLAALRAADLGARVVLLDSAAADCSNLVASSGLFSAAGTRFQSAAGIEDSPARWADDVMRKTGAAVDAAMLHAVTTRAADAAHFMADRLGLPIEVSPGLAMPGHTAPRLHSIPGPGGGALAAALMAHIATVPTIEVRLGVEADGLLVEDGIVAGVHTRAGVIRARQVLIASGGYAGNRAMLAAHAPEIMGAVYIGRGPNDGRGIAWARALGGAVALMDSYQGQGHTIPDGKGRLGPGLTSFGAIVVNDAGQRFADESMGPSEFGAFVLAQPGGTAVEVFDARIDAEAMQLSTYRDTKARGLVLQADTMEALAASFGLPGEALASTLAAYHRSVNGAPDAFGRTVALARLQPPYMAARVTGALAHTQGGLLVDAGARVRRDDGGVVAGLLAAGGAAAGISGHGAAGYLPGNGLGQAFALGFAAGETIAARMVYGGETGAHCLDK